MPAQNQEEIIRNAKSLESAGASTDKIRQYVSMATKELGTVRPSSAVGRGGLSGIPFGEAASKINPENLLPTLGGVVGGIIGGAATLPSGAGVPFGATLGATIGGGAGESLRNTVRLAKGESVPSTIGESLVQTGIEAGKQGAASLAGAGVIKVLEKVFVGLPRVLMNKIMNVSKKRLQAEVLDKAEEIGSKAANEWSNFGKSSSEILDRIKKDMPQIAKQVKSKVAEYTSKTDASVNTAKFFDDAVNPVVEKLKPNPVNQEVIDKLAELKTRYLKQYGKKISLENLDTLKKSLYDDIADSSWWKANDQRPDAIKSTIALARKARRIISDSVPGVADLNAQYGTYASMKAFLAGTEAGGGKSITKLFLEPGFEKVLSGTAIGLQKIGSPAFKAVAPAIQPAAQIGVGIAPPFLNDQ